MRFNKYQFDATYYTLWERGLLIPTPNHAKIYSVKFYKSSKDQASTITLLAMSLSDALQRACFALTYSSPWRPEDINLCAVFDEDQNILWVDEPYYHLIQKAGEFRGIERREFLSKFGMASAALLFGLPIPSVYGGTTTIALSGTASNFPPPSGEQVYTSAGTFNWTVPANVTSVCVICVGGGGGTFPGGSGGGGGGGGGLRYLNNFSVTAGSSIAIVVGAAGNSSSNPGSNTAGGNSSFNGTTLVADGGSKTTGASGASGGSGTSILGSIGGGNGGSGGTYIELGGGGGGGGGAGGYSGNGGNGGNGGNNSGGAGSPGSIGVGGAGGGGNGGPDGATGGAGGGVGLYGSGSSGTAGQAGSGGNGVNYGGGGGAGGDGGSGSLPGSGAVRIIWGTGKSFPSNAS